MKKSFYTLCALLTASALMMTGCEGIEITVTDYTSPSMQHTTTTTTNKETPIPDDDTDEDSSLDLTEEEYTQGYPVQDYQLGYAEVLSGLSGDIGTDYTAYLLHIDEDETPELAVIYGPNGMLYSFDGQEVYELDYLSVDYYAYSFDYRPYLSMTACSIGSTMAGGRHYSITTYTHENGRLAVNEVIALLDKDMDEIGYYEIYDFKEGEYIWDDDYEKLTQYDYGVGCSDSWKCSDELPPITKSQIEYWLTNWAT